MEHSRIALEKEIEHTLFQLMELEVEGQSVQMSQLFAKLLASKGAYQLYA